jgi:hypothetical protein
VSSGVELDLRPDGTFVLRKPRVGEGGTERGRWSISDRGMTIQFESQQQGAPLAVEITGRRLRIAPRSEQASAALVLRRVGNE